MTRTRIFYIYSQFSRMRIFNNQISHNFLTHKFGEVFYRTEVSFVIDIHQNMSISLFPVPFDHFLKLLSTFGQTLCYCDVSSAPLHKTFPAYGCRTMPNALYCNIWGVSQKRKICCTDFLQNIHSNLNLTPIDHRKAVKITLLMIFSCPQTAQ